MANNNRASACALALLALGALAGSSQWQGPTPVSAQAIRPAAAAGQVLHIVMLAHIANAPGLSGSGDYVSDQWLQFDAAGAIARSDDTEMCGTIGKARVQSRRVQLGNAFTDFNAAGRIISTGTTAIAPPFNLVGPPHHRLFFNAMNAASMRLYVAEARQGGKKDVRFLGRRVRDGIPVYAVQLTHVRFSGHDGASGVLEGRDTITYYARTDSYALRGLDIVARNAAGAVRQFITSRVTTYAVLPAAAVPPGIFPSHTPAGSGLSSTPIQRPGHVRHEHSYPAG